MEETNKQEEDAKKIKAKKGKTYGDPVVMLSEQFLRFVICEIKLINDNDINE